MSKTNSESIIDRAKRAGCWALGVYVFAVFFLLGALVSLINADLLRAIEGAVLAVACTALGIWLARKGIGR